MTRQTVSFDAPDSDLAFPINVRRVSGWKLLYFDEGTFVPDPDASDLMCRGSDVLQCAIFDAIADPVAR